MDKPLTTLATDLGPIKPEWTIAELIEWLREDSRQHDPELQRPLAAIEAALTGEAWTRLPSTVALIRSLSALTWAHGSSVVADILLPSRALSLVASPSDREFDGSGMPRAQVA